MRNFVLIGSGKEIRKKTVTSAKRQRRSAQRADKRKLSFNEQNLTVFFFTLQNTLNVFILRNITGFSFLVASFKKLSK